MPPRWIRRTCIAIGLSTTGLVQGCQGESPGSVQLARAMQAPAISLAAPGSIEPLEGIRRLAAPLTPSGMAPRVERLYVEEGDAVQAGQILAQFDNYPSVQAELSVNSSTIRSLESEIAILERQTRRFQSLQAAGVIASADYEERQLRLTELRNQLRQTQARRQVIEEQRQLAQLRAPITGTVLTIHSRAGEQPGADGVLDLADPHSMGAIAQVDEGDIPRLRIGQAATITSENGYFATPLSARIASIAQRVTPRRSLLTKPGLNKDSEPRVVEVKLRFNQATPTSIARMSGAKVMVQFRQP